MVGLVCLHRWSESKSKVRGGYVRSPLERWLCLEYWRCRRATLLFLASLVKGFLGNRSGTIPAALMQRIAKDGRNLFSAQEVFSDDPLVAPVVLLDKVALGSDRVSDIGDDEALFELRLGHGVVIKHGSSELSQHGVA